MTTTTTRNALIKYGAADINFPYGTNTNMDTIDAAIAKKNTAAATSPGVGDDSADGYSVGSVWYNTTGHKIFACETAAAGAAVWRQVWPALLADQALAADWDAGNYEIRAKTFESDVATGTAPLTIASTTKVANLNADLLDGLEDTAFVKHSLADAASDFLVASGADAFVKKTLAETKSILGIDTTFWTVFPGAPTRVSDSQFTITDTGGANSYAAMFPKGTVIKWEKSGGGFQCAMVKAAVYGANVVTIDILGNDLVAGFTLMKYCILPALEDVFIIPGKLPAAASTDIGKTIYWPDDRLVFSAIIRYKTACATTKGVWDINDDGTSIFTTKPEIAATATAGADQISNCILDTALTVVAAGSLVTLDYDSGHATTPGSDAYVVLYSMPHSWRYRA